MNTPPDTLYVGKRDVVICELGDVAAIYPGAYLLLPDGNAAYDAEGADTLEGIEALVAEYRALFPAAQVVWL
jgi:hypothetical protein